MLAAKNGHTGVLDALKGHEDAIKLTSRKHGLTAVRLNIQLYEPLCLVIVQILTSDAYCGILRSDW